MKTRSAGKSMVVHGKTVYPVLERGPSDLVLANAQVTTLHTFGTGEEARQFAAEKPLNPWKKQND